MLFSADLILQYCSSEVDLRQAAIATCLLKFCRILFVYMSLSVCMSERGTPRIEALILKSQLRWVGHIIRMPDSQSYP